MSAPRSWRSRLPGAVAGQQQQQQPAGAVEMAEQRASAPQQIAGGRMHGDKPWELSSRYGSSGDGLPSALETPQQPGISDAAPSSQQQAGSSVPLAPPEPHSQHKGVGEPGSASRPEGTVSSSSSLPPTGARPQQPASGRLPPSGDEQLDKYLAYLLTGCHRHRFLYYAGWRVTLEGCAALAAFLRQDRRVKAATLGDNSIGDEGVELLAEGLAANGTLVSLDLSNNAITCDGAIALAEALHSDKCCLAELQLANNKIGDDGAEALAAAAARSSLKRLVLTGNPISATQQQVVQHVLKTREYRVPPAETRATSSSSAERRSGSSSRHMRKASSGLQFDIELASSLDLNRGGGATGAAALGSSSSRVRHRELLTLPPAVAVAALTEQLDHLERSVASQVAQLMAELQQPQEQQQPQQQQQLLLVRLALRLAGRGYAVVLRTCCPSLDAVAVEQQPEHAAQQPSPASAGGSVLPAARLRHTFLRVAQPGCEQHVQAAVLVDPSFAGQFSMAHATARFEGVLEALPRVLCLAEPRLWHLLQLLSREVATAFKDARLSLPPWRQPGAVHDMWLSLHPADVSVEADASIEAVVRMLPGCAKLDAQH